MINIALCYVILCCLWESVIVKNVDFYIHHSFDSRWKYILNAYFHFVIVTNIYSVNIMIQNLEEFTYVRNLKICIQLAYLFHMRRGARFL